MVSLKSSNRLFQRSHFLLLDHPVGLQLLDLSKTCIELSSKVNDLAFHIWGSTSTSRFGSKISSAERSVSICVKVLELMFHLLDFDVEHVNVLKALENVQVANSGFEEVLSAKEIIFGKSLLIVLDLSLILSTLMSLPWAHVFLVHNVIQVLQSL